MQSQGAPCTRTFGEYMDDPQQVEEARLRSRVGCIVETAPAVCLRILNLVIFLLENTFRPFLRISRDWTFEGLSTRE